MVRDVLGSLLLLGGALWLWLGLVQAQRRQLRLLEAVSALTGLGSDRISICEGN